MLQLLLLRLLLWRLLLLLLLLLLRLFLWQLFLLLHLMLLWHRLLFSLLSGVRPLQEHAAEVGGGSDEWGAAHSFDGIGDGPTAADNTAFICDIGFVVDNHFERIHSSSPALHHIPFLFLIRRADRGKILRGSSSRVDQTTARGAAVVHSS
jgi:hypothetical protein